MRISSREITRNYVNQMNKAYSDYSDTLDQVSSGYKVTKASEDVSASSQALQTRISQNKVETQLSNITNYLSELSNTESTMSNVKSILTNINSELAVKAENMTTGDSGYAAIAQEISDLRDEIVKDANQQYNNKYIFGGTSASSAPFTYDSSGSLLYNGVKVSSIQKDTTGYYTADASGTKTYVPMDDDMYVDVGSGLSMTGNQVDKGTAMCVTYSGLDVFGYGTDSDGVSNNIISILSDLADAVADGDTDSITKYNDKLSDLADDFEVNVTNAGVKVNSLERAQNRLQDLSDSYTTKLGELIMVDDYEAATQESTDEYVLKAVLSMGSKLLPMSLMDYIS